jgi:hypothetical protein
MIQDQKELIAAKAKIKASWDAEAKVVIDGMNKCAEFERDTFNATQAQVDILRAEREPLELELWGARREDILRDTGTDPLTGETIGDIVSNMLLGKKPTKTQPASTHTPFNDPEVNFDIDSL